MRFGGQQKSIAIVILGALLAGTPPMHGGFASASEGGGTTGETHEDVEYVSASAISITAGGYHTCAVLADGTAKCWGANSYGGALTGQLGDGTTTNRLTPVSVSGISNAISITAGDAHTCAILDDGTVKCWGNNHQGQLGDGTTTDRSTPLAVPGLSNVISISGGWGHTCAVLGDGTAHCWGNNESGQLGDDTTTDRFAPTAVLGLSNAISITAGYAHTCTVLDDGTAQCWGHNGYGQLGDGTTTNRWTPTLVSGLSNAIRITASWHTCAILGDGTAKCWGANWYGQLGDGRNTDTGRYAHVVVSGLSNAISITASEIHTCAVLSDGTAKCWGSNESGQLGDGTATERWTPVFVQDLGATEPSTITTMSAVLPTARTGTSAIWDGSNAYIFGGEDDSGELNQIVRYNPASNQVTLMTATLPSGRSSTSAIWDGSNAYIFGGTNNHGQNDLNQIVRYNPASNTVTVVSATLPSSRAYTSAVWDGSNAYIFGGEHDRSYLNEIVRYNPATNVVTVMTAVLPTARSFTSSVWDGSNAYIFGSGGDFSDRSDQNIVRYNPTSNAVSAMAATLPEALGGASAVWDGSNAYVFGGDLGPEIYQYNPTSNAVELMASTITTGPAYTSAIWDGEHAYIFGGMEIDAWPPSDRIVRFSTVARDATLPGSPTGLSAATSSSAIDLSWNAPSSKGGASVTSYQIYRGTSSGSLSYYDTIFASLGTTYSNSDNLVDGMTYYYRVSAVNSAGEGPQSNPASATYNRPAQEAAPDAPTGLSATAVDCGEIALSWNVVSGLTYKIYRSPGRGVSGPSGSSGAATLYWGPETPESGSVQFQNTGSYVAAETTYYYQVSAVNSVGSESSRSSEVSASTPTCTTPPTPGAPTDLTPGTQAAARLIATKGESLSDLTTTIQWTAPSEPVEKYAVFLSKYPFVSPTSPTAEVTDTKWSTPTLDCGSTYRYQVQAYNSGGWGDLAPMPTTDRMYFTTADCPTSEEKQGGRGYFFVHGICSLGSMWTQPAEVGYPLWSSLTQDGTMPYAAPDYGPVSSTESPENLRRRLGAELQHFVEHGVLIGPDPGTGPLDEVVLVGHSNGGLMVRALLNEAAGDLEHRIVGVVTLDSPDLGAGSTFGYNMAREPIVSTFRQSKCPDTWVEWSINYINAGNPRGLAWLMDEVAPTRDDERLVRFVFGDCTIHTAAAEAMKGNVFATRPSCTNGNSVVGPANADRAGAILLSPAPSTEDAMQWAIEDGCSIPASEPEQRLRGLGFVQPQGDYEVVLPWSADHAHGAGVREFASLVEATALGGTTNFFQQPGTYDCEQGGGEPLLQDEHESADASFLLVALSIVAASVLRRKR